MHGLAWWGVEAMGGLRGMRSTWTLGDVPDEAVAEPEPGPTPSCEGDELLASAARMLVCAMPAGGGAGCARETADSFAIARQRCDRIEMSAAVTLLDPRVLDEIEPEPLMDLIEPAVLAEIQKAQQEPPPRPAVAPPPPRVDNMQTVETVPQENQEPPATTRFLAEHDSVVEKQTVARGTTEPMVARPQPSPQDTKEIPEPDRAEPDRDNAGEVEATQGAGRLAMRAPGQPAAGQEATPEVTPGLLNGSDAPLSANGFQIRRGTGERYEKAQEAMDPRRGENGGGGGGRTLPNLRPDKEALERALGGGSVDHLEDVEEGEATALNAKQWKYASFFNRAKRQIAQNWNPNRVLQAEDPRGNVYGVRDRITVLRVTLDSEGHLLDVIVVSGSGFDSLDEEAMRAFRAAEPFPNPPPDLVDPRSGRISFQFGFHLDNAERSNWKLFR
ncbi:MAG TPA: energy transducer TonB [Haliangium sp.]|nr:energy transducer TonB [Haliangium sp.]